MSVPKLDIVRKKRFVLDQLIQGEKIDNVVQNTLERFDGLERKEALSIVRAVYKDLAEFVVEDDTVVETHIFRYEELYRVLKSMGVDNLAMRALTQKEELLGIYDSIIEVDVRKNSLVVDNGDQYDLSLLSEQESKRMKFLLKKAKNG